MTQYITTARAKEALRSSYDGTDDSILGDILTSCSAFLDTYCNRSSGGFNVQTYDELYEGTGDNFLYLNNCPIVSIQRIASLNLPCAMVRNTDPDVGCRATVAVTSTGLTLTYIKNAVTTTSTLTFASYPTVGQLVTAINALGNNWAANTMSGLDGWSSTDLRAIQGAYGARIVNCFLYVHWWDLPVYRVQEKRGELNSPTQFYRATGFYPWRIQYTAGFSSFPDDLAQALAELVAATYYAREVNANTQSSSIGVYSYTQLASKSFDGLSAMAKLTINRYKVRRVPHFSTW